MQHLRGPWLLGESDETVGSAGASVKQWATGPRLRVLGCTFLNHKTGPSLHPCHTLSVCVCVCVCAFMHVFMCECVYVHL